MTATAPANEIWRDVVGWEGIYQVSSLGRVRSFDKVVRCGYGKTRVYPGRVLRPAMVQGYPTVSLWNNGLSQMARVHRLVCQAFHGPQPSPAYEVAHNDGNPANASSNNLRWATHTENEGDKLLHGTRLLGSRHHRAKLTEAQVSQIRASTDRQCDIAEKFGVSRATVCLIKGGKMWRHAQAA